MKKLVLILLPVFVLAQDYVLKKDVLSAGGRKISGTDYVLQGTISQTTIGDVKDIDYKGVIGFWHPPEAIPPSAPEIVKSEKSVNDIILTWNKITTDTLGNPETMNYYVVYRDTSPSFVPGPADSIGYVNHPDTTYTDMDAHGSADSYYYLVKAVDFARNKSDRSNMGYKFNKFLNENPSATDMNWVSLPYNNNYSSVSDITDEMSPNGTSINMLTRLREDQFYENWTYMFGMWLGDNFLIERGIGYQFTVVKDTTTVFTGSHDPDFSVPLFENPLTTDMNWVSIPYNGVYNTASDITDEYSPAGDPLNMLTRLREDQFYENWTYMFGMWLGDNFLIERGVSYQFTVISDTVWMPTIYSNKSGKALAKGPSIKTLKKNVYREPVWSIDTGDKEVVSSGKTKLTNQIKGRASETIRRPHLVIALVDFEDTKIENLTFTAYCLSHPGKALFESSIGCGRIIKEDKGIIWAEFGNLPGPWQPAEAAVIIVESKDNDGCVFGVKRFELDATQNPQYIDEIDFQALPEPRIEEKQNLVSRVTWQGFDDDVIIGYSLYEGDKKLNNEVLTECSFDVGEKPNYHIRPVFVGGYETVLSSNTMGVAGLNILPRHFTFGSISPNPSTAYIGMRYTLSSKAKVDITIFDIVGRKIRTLVSERQEPGYYSATWDGSDDIGRRVSSGVYFIIFEAKGHKVCKKVLVVK